MCERERESLFAIRWGINILCIIVIILTFFPMSEGSSSEFIHSPLRLPPVLPWIPQAKHRSASADAVADHSAMDPDEYETTLPFPSVSARSGDLPSKGPKSQSAPATAVTSPLKYDDDTSPLVQYKLALPWNSTSLVKKSGEFDGDFSAGGGSGLTSSSSGSGSPCLANGRLPGGRPSLEGVGRTRVRRAMSMSSQVCVPRPPLLSTSLSPATPATVRGSGDDPSPTSVSKQSLSSLSSLSLSLSQGGAVFSSAFASFHTGPSALQEGSGRHDGSLKQSSQDGTSSPFKQLKDSVLMYSTVEPSTSSSSAILGNPFVRKGKHIEHLITNHETNEDAVPDMHEVVEEVFGPVSTPLLPTPPSICSCTRLVDSPDRSSLTPENNSVVPNPLWRAFRDRCKSPATEDDIKESVTSLTQPDTIVSSDSADFFELADSSDEDDNFVRWSSPLLIGTPASFELEPPHSPKGPKRNTLGVDRTRWIGSSCPVLEPNSPASKKHKPSSIFFSTRSRFSPPPSFEPTDDNETDAPLYPLQLLPSTHDLSSIPVPDGRQQQQFRGFSPPLGTGSRTRTSRVVHLIVPTELKGDP